MSHRAFPVNFYESKFKIYIMKKKKLLKYLE